MYISNQTPPQKKRLHQWLNELLWEATIEIFLRPLRAGGGKGRITKQIIFVCGFHKWLRYSDIYIGRGLRYSDIYIGRGLRYSDIYIGEDMFTIPLYEIKLWVQLRNKVYHFLEINIIEINYIIASNIDFNFLW